MNKKLFFCINILKELEKSEFVGFKKYFNKSYSERTNTIKVLHYLEKLYPFFQKEKLDSQLMQKKIFNSHRNAPTYLTRGLIELTEILEQFLVNKKMKSDSHYRAKIVMDIFKERNIRPNYLSANNFLKKNLIEREEEERAFLKFNVNFDKYYSSGFEEVVNLRDELPLAMKGLDEFYFLQKFKMACEIFSRKDIAAIDDLSINYLFENKDLVEKHENCKTIHLYILLLTYLKERTLSNARNLQSFYLKNISDFSKSNQKTGFIYIYQKVASNSNFTEEQRFRFGFELFNLADTNGFIVDHNGIGMNRFTSIILTACEAGEIDWAEYFYDKYNKMVVDSSEKNRIPTLLGECYLKFYTGNYKDVCLLLNNPKFPHPIQNLYAKVLVLKCLVEQSYIENFEIIDSKLQALKSFITRNKGKIGRANSTRIQNFIKFLTRFINQKSGKKKLLYDLSKKPSTAKRWLEEKIKER